MQHGLRARALLLVAAALVLLTGCGGSGDDDGGSSATTGTTTGAVELGPAFGPMASLPGVLDGPPPWGANGDKLQLRLREIGLDPLSAEGQVVHIHQHLDIFADGKPVTVPANIGIDPGQRFISALHTHDDSGILHVESPTPTSYSLGQVFAVWGLRLDANCIGGLCASGGKRLRTWVNGKPLAGDPTRIVLAEHQVIVLAYGIPAQDPKPVPTTHDFAAEGV